MRENDNLQGFLIGQVVFAALERKILISCSVINCFHYHSSLACDSRATKRKTNTKEGVFDGGHCIGLSMLQTLLSCFFFFGWNKKLWIFILITPPLYNFSTSLCIYVFPERLYGLSGSSLLPYSIWLARSINTMKNLAVNVRRDLF